MNPDDDAGQSLQRIKVGLTGLALVLLLIALASALSRSAGRAPVTTAKSDVVANLALVNDSDPAGEPLAQIGVAPAAPADPSSGGAPARR